MKVCTKKLSLIQLLSTVCCLFNCCPHEVQSYPNETRVKILTCCLCKFRTIFVYKNVVIGRFILVKRTHSDRPNSGKKHCI